VAKPEWGTKRTCFGCGARFYDLLRDPIICPVCATVYDPERQPRAKRGAAAAREDAESKRKPVKAVAASALKDDAVEGEELESAVSADLEDETEESTAASSNTDDDDDLEAENNDLIEDTSDLGEDDDDIGEVMEHIGDDDDEKS